jgi:hypothetical protein
MMNKKFWLFLGIVFSVFLLSGFWVYRFYFEKNPIEVKEIVEDPFQEGLETVSDSYQSVFASNASFESWDSLLLLVRTGKVNLLLEIEALREACPENISIARCNDFAVKTIDKKFDGDIAENLKRLYNKLFLYESEIERLEDNLLEDVDEKYKVFRKKRRKFFSESDAKLIFGMEEAEMDFQEAFQTLLDGSDELTGDEMVAGYEDLKKKIYGTMYETILSKEDPYQQYQVELQLREYELEQLPQDQREVRIRKIQEKYLGKEGADKFEKLVKEEEAFFQKMEEYKKKESDFIRENKHLSKEDLEDKLKSMKIQEFGTAEME